MCLLIRLLIAAAVLCLHCIHALPVLQLDNSTETTNSESLTFDLNCTPHKIVGDRRALPRDCIYAVTKLPFESDSGIFHNGAPLDAFTLPIATEHGGCFVTVTTITGGQDRSSWIALHHAATQLITACAEGPFPLGLTGGSTYLGDRSEICITVGKEIHRYPRSLGGGNGTDLLLSA